MPPPPPPRPPPSGGAAAAAAASPPPPSPPSAAPGDQRTRWLHPWGSTDEMASSLGINGRDSDQM
eukprot:9491260-Pyramimonas_sp.AAC.1